MGGLLLHPGHAQICGCEDAAVPRDGARAAAVAGPSRGEHHPALPARGLDGERHVRALSLRIKLRRSKAEVY